MRWLIIFTLVVIDSYRHPGKNKKAATRNDYIEQTRRVVVVPCDHSAAHASAGAAENHSYVRGVVRGPQSRG